MRGILLATTLLVGGCSLIPFYKRPDLPVASAYPTGPAYQIPSSLDPAVSADAIGWRDFFTDPRLQTLIEIALRNNRDLRVAALNIAQAQGQYRVQRADLFPSISGTGTGLYEGLPNSTSVPNSSSSSTSATSGTTASTTSSITPSASQGGTFRYYTAGIGFTSYELDFFGRLRSLSRQAFEQYLNQVETRRSTQISLVAQVASAYLTLLADQDSLRITQETLRSQTDTYNLTRAMLNAGTTTAVSVRQAETSVDTARANLAQYTRQVAQDDNALTLLLGQPIPADLPPGRNLGQQGLLADLPAGLPADLLTRRPDILAAEHSLLAANANIGAARAAFFPSITLTASDGVASNQLSRLFTGGATTWSFAPQINIPIFTFGRNAGNLDVAKAEKQIEVAQYEKAIQTAFREVADALAARGTYGDQLRANNDLVNAAADAYRLSQLRFRAGVDNFLSTLDSQRTLYSAQLTAVSVQEAQQANLVTLYKALGGGWNERTAAR